MLQHLLAPALCCMLVAGLLAATIIILWQQSELACFDKATLSFWVLCIVMIVAVLRRYCAVHKYEQAQQLQQELQPHPVLQHDVEYGDQAAHADEADVDDIDEDDKCPPCPPKLRRGDFPPFPPRPQANAHEAGFRGDPCPRPPRLRRGDFPASVMVPMLGPLVTGVRETH